MVPKSSHKRKAVGLKSNTGAVFFFGLFFVVCATLMYVVLTLMPSGDTSEQNISDDNGIETAVTTHNESDSLPAKVDFQSVIDEWVTATKGNKSVLIYDLDRDEYVGSYNPDEEYNTASLYKLFVVYEGYRRIQNGLWDSETIIESTGNTILECLDRAIRESYSPCAESLLSMIGQEEMQEIISNDFDIFDTSILALTSTPSDISKMMQIFYQHDDVTDGGLIAGMKDSFLVQPSTTYNWRQGLPSGFSEKVNVYSKVGWDYNPDGGYWNTYHDAAIVEFPEHNRHFVVVVMTNYVDYKNIAKLGTMIEETYYSHQ